MSYVEPKNLISSVINNAEKKFYLSQKDTLIRSFMGGALLGLAAFFAINVSLNTGNHLIGSLLFPVGFIILYLFKFDLLTGVFTITPLPVIEQRNNCRLQKLIKIWITVFFGNLFGALLVAFLTSFIITHGYQSDGGEIAQKISKIGEMRTLGYKEYGILGWFTVFIRGALCNWMVSIGVVGSLMSSSLQGKVIIMYMPIVLFFYMGFEHSIVNMYLFPFSMIMGGDFTIIDYLVWNEIPTVLGNLVGGLLFVGLPLYFTYFKKT